MLRTNSDGKALPDADVSKWAASVGDSDVLAAKLAADGYSMTVRPGRTVLVVLPKFYREI